MTSEHEAAMKPSVMAAVEKAERVATESGAWESYRAVGEAFAELRAALAEAQAKSEPAALTDADFVRSLLWNDHPECCGSPVVGAEYMGQREMVCCGCPEPSLLNDRQIVASLRERFPVAAIAATQEQKP